MQYSPALCAGKMSGFGFAAAKAVATRMGVKALVVAAAFAAAISYFAIFPWQS